MPYAEGKVKRSDMNLRPHIPRLRSKLLAWYDSSGRTLPWRIRPEDRDAGEQANPYAVWLSEIMLQQTTVPHATPYWEAFLTKWPTVRELADAAQDDVLAAWAGLGYYARARNLHKCAQLIRDQYSGEFPQTEQALLKLPGIGPYTAATMAAICFNEATNIVDGNVERVIARLHAEDAPLPKSKKLLAGLAAPIADPDRPGDYGQALMDLGATICTPRGPDCPNCVWSFACQAFKDGNPEDYPVKIKKNRPIRYGAVFALMHDGRVLLRKRPDDGLLGGMLELPGTDWGDAYPETPLMFAPMKRNWEKCDAPVKHVFTHFELWLEVFRAEGDGGAGLWVPFDDMTDYPIPSLTKKAILQALKN